MKLIHRMKSGETARLLLGVACVAALLASGAPRVATGSSTYKILYSFNAQNAGPNGPLIEVRPGQFRGTTDNVSPFHNLQTLFSVDVTGKFSTVHIFHNASSNLAGVTQASNGLLYGSLQNLVGSIGSLIFDSTLSGQETDLVSFAKVIGLPSGMIESVDGNLYGTSALGGDFQQGFIFRLSPAGQLTVTDSFAQGNATHSGPLLLAGDGNLYGTKLDTGSGGEVFRADSLGGNAITLHVFSGGGDGNVPTGALIEGNDGNLYGATSQGGAFGNGEIYRLTKSGVFSIVHSFSSTEGSFPTGLMQASDLNLYGTTVGLVGLNQGSLWQCTLNGTLTTAESFNEDNGGSPTAPPVQGVSGALFGTTGGGGATNDGVVYRLNLGLQPPKPQITIFSPTSGAVGTQVLLIGNYFIGTVPSGVTFNGVPASFMQRSNNYIVATVPAGATSGPIAVTTANGTVLSTVGFTVQ